MIKFANNICIIKVAFDWMLKTEVPTYLGQLFYLFLSSWWCSLAIIASNRCICSTIVAFIAVKRLVTLTHRMIRKSPNQSCVRAPDWCLWAKKSLINILSFTNLFQRIPFAARICINFLTLFLIITHICTPVFVTGNQFDKQILE